MSTNLTIRVSGRRRRVVAALALAVLAGCGDDDDGRVDAGNDAGGKSDAGMVADAGTTHARDASKGDADAHAAADAAQGDLRDVAIHFRAHVGSAKFACGTSYPDQGSTGVVAEPTDYRFYVQDLALLDADGNAVPVQIDERSPWQAPGVALLDFEDASGNCVGNPETNDVITGKVPEGHYVGVAFANGVPEALNHADPTTLPAPLQFPGLAWTWLSGYRFIKAELRQVLDDDAGVGAIPGVGLAHPGAAGCSGNPGAGTVMCQKPNRNAVVLQNFDPDQDAIAADIGAIFSGSDLSHDAQCHGAGEACRPMFEKLGIDYDSGGALPKQSVYRVE